MFIIIVINAAPADDILPILRVFHDPDFRPDSASGIPPLIKSINRDAKQAESDDAPVSLRNSEKSPNASSHSERKLLDRVLFQAHGTSPRPAFVTDCMHGIYLLSSHSRFRPYYVTSGCDLAADEGVVDSLQRLARGDACDC